MKNTKNLMDTMVESSSKTINNWVETAKKAQKAAMSGASLEKNSELYKEWLTNQMSIFKNITLSNDSTKEGTDAAEKNQSTATVEEFYKNWYNNQLEVYKKMTDFNQNLLNTWMNYGKPAQEVNENFSKMNQAWTGVYENWVNTLNNTYNNLSNTFKNNLNKDVFEQMFNSQNVMMKMNEFYAPFLKAMQNGTFNMDTYKKMFDVAEYKKQMESIFAGFMPQNNLKEFFESYATQVQSMISNTQNFSKEYQENLQKFVESYPQLFSTDFSKMIGSYNQIQENWQKTFAPFVKLMPQGKEKERMQASFETMDKMAVYYIKNAQLQYLILGTGQKALEQSLKLVADKFQNETEITSFNKFFQEWVNLNENTFIELFNSDEYSALRAEVTSLSLAVKKDLEVQFENQMAAYPFVFKTDMNELYQTIHDLKNKVKALETQIALIKAGSVELEEETKVSKTNRKK